MMEASQPKLSDDVARRAAMACHGRSFLVEAGAGSGKTAVLAGRIAMLLAGGEEPKSIAAVTFTELAASELLIRVREFVDKLKLKEESIPTELRIALPQGISDAQRKNLEKVDAKLDDMTCSTIHGFCRRLITPYPAEANIDPDASVMDTDQADLEFREVIDDWLHGELASDKGDLLAEMAKHDPKETRELIRTILQHLRSNRELTSCEPKDLAQHANEFLDATKDFENFLDGAFVKEPETVDIAEHFRDLAKTVCDALPANTPDRLVKLLVAAPNPKLLTNKGEFRKYNKKEVWKTAVKHAGLSLAGANG